MPPGVREGDKVLLRGLSSAEAKPHRRLASVADAIKDVSKRGGIVLDLFGGSGSSLIAADKAGLRGPLCELDPAAPERLASRRRRSQVPR
jgi:DNA modification methylase